MSLYVIRHAHALDGADDAARPLSARGRKQVAALARLLANFRALETAEVWHTPRIRSRETAELLVQHLGLAAKLVEVDGLDFVDDPSIMATRLRTRHAPLVLVGHEPHLSGLLSLLVAGVAYPPRFVVKKCAAIALERDDDLWAVRWHVSPEIVGE